MDFAAQHSTNSTRQSADKRVGLKIDVRLAQRQQRSRRDQRPPTHTTRAKQGARLNRRRLSRRTHIQMSKSKFIANKLLWNWSCVAHSASLNEPHSSTYTGEQRESLINGGMGARHGKLTANWVRRPPLCEFARSDILAWWNWLLFLCTPQTRTAFLRLPLERHFVCV